MNAEATHLSSSLACEKGPQAYAPDHTRNGGRQPRVTAHFIEETEGPPPPQPTPSKSVARILTDFNGFRRILNGFRRILNGLRRILNGFRRISMDFEGFHKFWISTDS